MNVPRANFGNDLTKHYCGDCFEAMLKTWMTGSFPTEETVRIRRI